MILFRFGLHAEMRLCYQLWYYNSFSRFYPIAYFTVVITFASPVFVAVDPCCSVIHASLRIHLSLQSDCFNHMIVQVFLEKNSNRNLGLSDG